MWRHVVPATILLLKLITEAPVRIILNIHHKFQRLRNCVGVGGEGDTQNLHVTTNVPISGKNLLCFLTIEGATEKNVLTS